MSVGPVVNRLRLSDDPAKSFAAKRKQDKINADTVAALGFDPENAVLCQLLDDKAPRDQEAPFAVYIKDERGLPQIKEGEPTYKLVGKDGQSIKETRERIANGLSPKIQAEDALAQARAVSQTQPQIDQEKEKRINIRTLQMAGFNQPGIQAKLGYDHDGRLYVQCYEQGHLKHVYHSISSFLDTRSLEAIREAAKIAIEREDEIENASFIPEGTVQDCAELVPPNASPAPELSWFGKAKLKLFGKSESEKLKEQQEAGNEYNNALKRKELYDKFKKVVSDKLNSCGISDPKQRENLPHRIAEAMGEFDQELAMELESYPVEKRDEIAREMREIMGNVFADVLIERMPREMLDEIRVHHLSGPTSSPAMEKFQEVLFDRFKRGENHYGERLENTIVNTRSLFCTELAKSFVDRVNEKKPKGNVPAYADLLISEFTAFMDEHSDLDEATKEVLVTKCWSELDFDVETHYELIMQLTKKLKEQIKTQADWDRNQHLIAFAKRIGVDGSEIYGIKLSLEK